MAFSPGHYRAGSGGQGYSGAIDGVQVKINEKYVPEQKVTLPLDYKTGNPSEVLFMEYDFSLETKVLEWSENQRRASAALEAAKQEEKERIAAEKALEAEKASQSVDDSDKEETSGLPNGTETESSEEANKPKTDKGASPNGPFMNMSMDILLPTVLPGKAGANSMDPVLPMANSTSFNLADFENEQDPFDNLELKTLDDMAELNKVLQGAQTDSKTSPGAKVIDNTAKKNVAGFSSEPNGATVSSVQDETRDANQPEPLNIKDVEYPDFDTLETPDISLSDPSYSISSQQNEPGSYSTNTKASDNQAQVRIQPGAFNSVSFSNRKPEDSGAVQNSQRSSSPRSYNPLPPIGNSSVFATSAQQSIPQNTDNRSAVSNAGVYSYEINSDAKQSNTDSLQHSSVINGLTQYTSYASSNPWSTAAVSGNPWSSQPTNKATTTGASWQPPKSYTTSNPWDPPSTSAYSTSPWGGATASVQSTNPWGPPSLYGSSSSSSSATLRSARSNPDLTKLTERPVRVLPKSHTPPPITRTKTPPPRPASTQPWNPYSVLPPTSSASSSLANSKAPTRNDALADPYNGMSHDMKRFVDRITDMGFSRARVARTALKLGQDDKKVVDHLCLVNKLTDDGLEADQVETALHLFSQQEDKAKEYMKLLAQFKELGFDDCKIQQALVDSDLDENKTLDALTSS